jgi:hypothetical protein
MKRELALFRRWMEQRPTDNQTRFEAAATLSWLGTTAEKQSRFEESEAWFTEALRELTQLRKADPANAVWREEWLDTQLLLTDAHSKAGHFAQARDNRRNRQSRGRCTGQTRPDQPEVAGHAGHRPLLARATGKHRLAEVGGPHRE